MRPNSQNLKKKKKLSRINGSNRSDIKAELQRVMSGRKSNNHRNRKKKKDFQNCLMAPNPSEKVESILGLPKLTTHEITVSI